METKAYKVTCLRNSEAIAIHEHLSKDLCVEDSGIEIFREGKEIFIRKEDLDNDPDIDKDDIIATIEDACLVYEIEGMPDFTESTYDFDIAKKDDYL